MGRGRREQKVDKQVDLKRRETGGCNNTVGIFFIFFVGERGTIRWEYDPDRIEAKRPFRGGLKQKGKMRDFKTKTSR